MAGYDNVGARRIIKNEQFTYTGTAGVSAAAPAVSGSYPAKEVLLISTTACFVALGSAPTATATGNGNQYLPAGVFLQLAVDPSDKVSAIQSASGGTMYVTWLG